jgi:23S rRNA U2552 (ribose-2'-O)-methylase RlmE/FtsJ
MEFANNDAKVDVVLSDMYVGGKLLARVQAERRFLAIQKLKTTSKKIHNEEPEENVDVENIMKSSDRRQVLQSRTLSRYKEVILTVQQKPDSHDYVVSEKNVLSSTKKEDVEILHSEYL